MSIRTLVFNPFQENTYILFDETKECIIVDAGCYSTNDQQELVAFIQQNELKPKLAVNTHGHVDHVLGNAFIKETFNIPIAGHPEDLPLIQMASKHALMYGFSIEDVPTIDQNLNHNDTITFGNTTLKVIHTPGHSLGGICLLNETEKFLISGDTLFNGSIGRTDLPGGSYDQLLNSIGQRLMTLDDDITIYPGHGDPSTIGEEKTSNPFLA